MPDRADACHRDVQTTYKTIKLYSWLSHAAGVRRVFECRGWTIVFTRASPWFVLPEMLPIVTTIEDACVDISRAVLACLFHAESEHAVACARATLEAIHQLPLADDTRLVYHQLVKTNLTARQLEQIPRRILDIDENAELGPRELSGAYYTRGRDAGLQEGLHEGRRQGLQEGRLTEARRLLHHVLARRGLLLGATDRTRIDTCADPALLQRWLDAALVARTPAAVFDISA